MLGDTQWKWLEQQLKQPADARLLISSIQLLNSGHRFEKWANMPDEQNKLYKLLRDTKTMNKTIVLSGDRHMSEFSHRDFKDGNQLWDITSSGLSHAGGGFLDKNPYATKVGKRFGSRSFGSLTIHWEDIPRFNFQLIDNDGEAVRQVDLKLEPPR